MYWREIATFNFKKTQQPKLLLIDWSILMLLNIFNDRIRKGNKNYNNNNKNIIFDIHKHNYKKLQFIS